MTSFYRLATAIHAGTQQVFLEQDAQLYPLSPLLTDEDQQHIGGHTPDDLLPLLQNWEYWRAALPDRLDKAKQQGATALSPADVTFCPPVGHPAKLICIGSNYRDHIEEMNIPMLPDYPYSFLKPASTTLRGSGAEVKVPDVAKMVDWEAELAVVIGTPAHHVSAADAPAHIAGYMNLNDISARDWIANRPAVGIDWVRHKGFDGFAPAGPYFVPAEFVPDPMNLPIRLSVNGVVKQASNTEQMVIGINAIIEHLSGIMTLEPGDLIATGTPAGVGHGRSPQEFLKAGDHMEVEIGNLGVLETRMI